MGTAGSVELRAAGGGRRTHWAEDRPPPTAQACRGGLQALVTRVTASSDLLATTADTLSESSVSRDPGPFKVVGLGFLFSYPTNILLGERQSRSGFFKHVLSTQLYRMWSLWAPE